MSVLPPDRVYTGLWIDRVKGNVLGPTITTTTDHANIIVAILSVSIAFAGSHLWDIVAFCSFASKATHTASDGVHHQRQILLRNTSSPAGVILKTIEMYYEWRKHNARPLSKLVCLCLIAAVCSIGFMIAGILSSQVVSTTHIQVLAKSKSCGFALRYNMREEQDENLLAGEYHTRAAQQSARYAADCYNASSLDPGCQIFTTKSIPFETSYYVNCPFEDYMCNLANHQAMKMDTGQMWSDKIFGINAKHDDTVSLQRVTTCSPINMSQYIVTSPMLANETELISGRQPFGGEEKVAFNLGPSVNWGDPTFFLTTAFLETQFAYSVGATNRFYGDNQSMEAFPWFPPAWWDPISPLRRTNGDLALIAVSANGLSYPQPVDDPVFAAHRMLELPDFEPGETPVNITSYLQDDAAGIVVCVEQVQFCTSNGRCTAFAPAADAALEATGFGLTPIANATLYSFANSLLNHEANLAILQTILPMVPLIASDGSRDGYTVLPPNQWELEVKYWQAIALAMLQKTMSDVAIGQGISGTQYDDLPHWPAGPAEKTLCDLQKMMAPHGFSNINVFGLSVIIATCGLIIITNLTLGVVLRWLPWQIQQRRVAIEQWHQDEILTFQRLAYESNGLGTWKGLPYRVLVTTDDEPFQRLADVVDLPKQSDPACTSYKAEKVIPVVSIRTLSSSDEDSAQKAFQFKFSTSLPNNGETSNIHDSPAKATTTVEPLVYDDNEYQALFSSRIS